MDDKYRIEHFGFYCEVGHSNPMTPVFENKTLFIPGRPGAWDFGSEIKEKHFSFPLKIDERFYSDIQQKLTKFNEFLFDSYGFPRKIKMALDYQPERFYYVKLAGQIVPKWLEEELVFELPLIAQDPFSYADINAYDSLQNHLYDTGLLFDKGLMYDNPTSFTWLNARHYSGVYNHSHLRPPLNLSIAGRITNPKITNQTTGEILYLPSLENFSDELEIDATKYTIKKNGKNALSEYSGAFLFLAPGENGLQFDGESPNAKVTYLWRHKFI